MPESYQQPTRAARQDRPKTVSQSLTSNTQRDTATVRRLIEGKGRGVHTISPDDTIAAAVGKLRDHNVGVLVVTDAKGQLCGILSERDIVRKLAETPGQTLPQTVSENMTHKVQTCGLDDALVSVLGRMSKGRFRHMPVVDDAGLAGIVTVGDVVNFRLAELEHEALQLKQMIVG